MDNRIDLTENRDFRKRRKNKILTLEGGRDKQRYSMAWNTPTYGVTSTNAATDPFYTTSSYINMPNRSSYYSYNPDGCDRCGRTLRIYPWTNPRSGLCSECEGVLDAKYGSMDKDKMLLKSSHVQYVDVENM